MKCIHQDRFGPEEGNCYQACLASILELPINDVPHYVNHFANPDYFIAAQKWLQRFELMIVRVVYNTVVEGKEYRAFCPVPDGTICIGFGDSPNYPGTSHAVVGMMTGLEFEMIHDPSPTNKGITGEPAGIDFIVSRKAASVFVSHN